MIMAEAPGLSAGLAGALVTNGMEVGAETEAAMEVATLGLEAGSPWASVPGVPAANVNAYANANNSFFINSPSSHLNSRSGMIPTGDGDAPEIFPFPLAYFL